MYVCVYVCVCVCMCVYVGVCVCVCVCEWERERGGYDTQMLPILKGGTQILLILRVEGCPDFTDENRKAFTPMNFFKWFLNRANLSLIISGDKHDRDNPFVSADKEMEVTRTINMVMMTYG